MQTKELSQVFSAAQTVGSTSYLVSTDASGNLRRIEPYRCMNVKVISNTADLNTITEPGRYSVAGQCVNSPTSVNTAGLIMDVYEHSSGYIQQLVFAMRLSTPVIYCRTKEGASANWRPWYETRFALVGGYKQFCFNTLRNLAERRVA